MTSYRVLVSNDSHAWTAVRNESGDVVSGMKRFMKKSKGGEAGAGHRLLNVQLKGSISQWSH